MPTSEVIALPKVRLSFPRLSQPKAFEDGQDERFEATFLLDPSNKVHREKIKEIKTAAKKIALEHWNGKIPKNIKVNFGMADEDGKEYEGYEGMFYVASNKKAKDGRPLITDNKKQVVQAGDDNFPYGGCYVNATVSLWTNHHKKGGPRILVNLRGVMFAGDGEPFSSAAGPKDPDAEFDEFEGDFGDDPTDDDDFDDDIPF